MMMVFARGMSIPFSIIENGIDIPRANTIIINRADNYGLSQLYQLRGRVGRSNRRAYAYLLIPAEQELSPIARRRLAAIREFSDLGAGFRIAARDRKSTRLNSSHLVISYAVFCLKKKKNSVMHNNLQVRGTIGVRQVIEIDGHELCHSNYVEPCPPYVFYTIVHTLQPLLLRRLV